MASDFEEFTEDLPDPGWRERLDSIRRAARALVKTRVEIFREELAGKGSLAAQGIAGVVLALAFVSLALVLLTALVAMIFTRLFGGPIAGLAAALVLYLLIAAAVGFFGARKLSRVRPLDFPITSDDLRKDFGALREEGPIRDEGPTSPQALAAERASIRPGESGEEKEDRSREVDLEERFRAGSE